MSGVRVHSHGAERNHSANGVMEHKHNFEEDPGHQHEMNEGKGKYSLHN